MISELFKTQESNNSFDISKAIEKKLIDVTGINNEKVRFVLDVYGKSVAKRLLSNEGYSVSSERARHKSRRVIFFRLKRFDGDDLMAGPELRIEVNSINRNSNYRQAKIVELPIFAHKIAKISKEERYKFPIA